MPYTDPTSTLQLLPMLPQSFGSSGYSLTVTRLGNHITRADNIINGKISKRYDISQFNDTLTSAPPMLATISQDISSYYTLRGAFSSDNQNVLEWTDKFQDALAILDEIRDGKIDLVNTSGSVIEERSSTTTDYIESNTESYQAFFDEDSELNWKVDVDKLNSIRDKR